MIHEPITVITDPSPTNADNVVPHSHEAGAALGFAHRNIRRHGRSRVPTPDRRGRLNELITQAAARPQANNAAWILDNFRLILGAEKEVREFALNLRDFCVAVDSSGSETARVILLARGYLETSGYNFCEQELCAFLEGYQETAELAIGEIWSLKPALQLELLDRLIEADSGEWALLISSLRKIGEMPWRDLFEAASLTHHVLSSDPAGAYSRMDFDSRDRYRRVLAELAKHSTLTELKVAEAALDLCRQASVASDGSRAAFRRTHVGFYLLDRGRSQLEAIIGYRPSLSLRIPRLILQYPTAFYLGGIELLTLFIVFSILYQLDSVAPAIAGLLLLILPATQAAADFINHLTTFLLGPRVLPKLDFSEGIPDDCATMVAVPTLLLNEAQVHDLALDLEIRYLSNRDPNLYFALLTDTPDSDRPEDQDDALVAMCVRLIEGLNQRYRSDERSPFFLFHRHRSYNLSEGRWMGWERKRGKLLDLNQLLRGSYDAFPTKVGNLGILPGVRYVITLDSDTQLPRDSAAKLIGAMAHPLNQAVVDPDQRVVVEGYGILQPRIGISVQSAARSRLASSILGTNRIRYLHARHLGRVSGSFRRRHLYRQRYL